eukprot:4819961-Amphidinium_carterae.1
MDAMEPQAIRSKGRLSPAQPHSVGSCTLKSCLGCERVGFEFHRIRKDAVVMMDNNTGRHR